MRSMLIVGLMCLVGVVRGDDPCKSGPQPNQRPGPYAALVSVGPQRGTQHCYICEAENRPIMIVFARTLSDPLGKLVHRMDKLMNEHKAAELRSWVTFLAEDQTAFDRQVVAWGQKHATGKVPLAVFEDVVGPPTYLLHREADVTVLLSVKQKVVANFAYRKGELNDAAIEQIVKTAPKIATAAK
ncbi:MAG: hypothetical protein L0Y71_07035 [Gemmataceae bacterium]|nr:hypothetical protein [Gemmataceae bacterium]